MLHAHLLEIRNLQLPVKNLAHKGVDFYVQNSLKLAYEHLKFQNFFRGCDPRTLVKGEGKEGEEKRGERRGGSRGGRVASWLLGG